MNTATKPNGAAAAALLAAAIGVFVIGLMTSLAAASPGWANLLNWFGPVGPLSGKTGVGVIIWLIAWGFLHSRYKDVELNLGRTLRWTWVLVLLGWLGTFPPFFDLLIH